MKITDYIGFIVPFVRLKFFKQRLPVAVSWELTWRCNLKCKYCGRKDICLQELSTDLILDGISKLKSMGVKIISFSGGEPLLRDDIGEILLFCKKNKITTYLISNGLLVPEKINELKEVSLLKISYDGPATIHDSMRGAGSYRGVMAAIAAAKNKGIKINLNTVISKNNIDSVEAILDFAHEKEVGIKFTPVNEIFALNKDIAKYLPEQEKYKYFINYLIKAKQKGDKYIINSLPSLKYIYNWPVANGQTECYAGIAKCDILPNGEVFPCSIKASESFLKKSNAWTINNIDQFFKNDVLYNGDCRNCWCTATLEMNNLFSLKKDSVLSYFKSSFLN